MEKFETSTPSDDVVDVSDIEKGGGGATPPHHAPLSKDDTITQVLEVQGYHRHPDNKEPGHTDVDMVQYISEVTEAGEKKFHKLSWFQLTVVLTVAAVALGTLSMPLYVTDGKSEDCG